MNIAILDDDLEFLELMKGHVENFMKSIISSYRIDIINQDFLVNINQTKYDIIFLDIDLEEANGIKIAKLLRNNENEALIIFVSNHDDLVFSSLDVRPFHFIRKVNLDKELKITFTLLKDYLQKNLKFITLDFYGRKKTFFIKDINYLESQGHDLILHTTEGKYKYRSTMSNMINKINSKKIVQIQKSYAINLDYINEIAKYVIQLKDGSEYNIGRKFKDNFIQMYKDNLLK